MNATWNDLKDDLFDDSTPNREIAKPVSEDSPLFVIPCNRCRGTGSWGNHPLYMRRCFGCNGTGKMTRKTDPAKLAARRERKALTREQEREQLIEGFKADFPAEWAWLEEKAPTFEFAASLRTQLLVRGSLSEKQMATVTRLAQQDAHRKAEKQASFEQRAAAAPTTDASAIEASFARAKAKGLKKPKMGLANFRFSLAPEHGKNAGALYIKEREREGAYLGKVMKGRLFLVPEARHLEAEVLAVIADPESAAIAYGKTYGICAICSRDLTDPESVARGIGPKCADNFGW